MLRIAVCDSSVADAQELVNKIHQLASEMRLACTVDSFRGARPLLEAAAARPYRVIFLETEIGGTGGIELARKLRFGGAETDFVFVTSKEEYALAAYSVFPLGYILKRVTLKKLYPIFVRLQGKEKGNGRAMRCMTADGGEALIDRDELLYIEVMGNRLFFHCKRETVEGVGSLSTTAASLPERQFYRAHRNFIVNLQYAQKIGHYFFGMQNGEKVAIAKNRYTEAKEIFERFFKE